MAYLSREQILGAKDVTTREVQVPEWADPESGADTVLVRALSGYERDAFEASLRMQRGKEILPDTRNARAKLVGRAIIDEEGKRVFTDQDIHALGAKSAVALNRVFEVVSEMSGLNDTAVEEAEENLDGDPTDEPTSDSQ